MWIIILSGTYDDQVDIELVKHDKRITKTIIKKCEQFYAKLHPNNVQSEPVIISIDTEDEKYTMKDVDRFLKTDIL